MRLSRFALLLVALLAPAGCADRPNGNSDPDIKFRHAAREVYEALIIESCTPNPALRRATVLAREIAAVRAFEQRAGSGPPHAQLEVVRDDIAHRLATNSLGCREDSDERFAARHVEMARNSVRTGLREMETLAASLTTLPASITELPASDGAAFRASVRLLVEALHPPCRITEAAGDDEVLAPARAELSRFRERLGRTPYAAHFDVAQADALHEGSLWVAECAEPARSTAAQASRRALDGTRREIARLTVAAHL